MTRGLRVAAATAALAVAGAASAFAHPTALTAVTVVVGESTADVAIVTDGAALKAKLAAMRRTLADAIDLRADGIHVPLVEVTMAAARASTDAAGSPRQPNTIGMPAAAATIRLRGPLPAGARQVTWSSSIVLGSYPVVFQQAGDERDTTAWLQGTETSAPFTTASPASAARWRRVARAIALGYTHILPDGLDHILFVLGLFFLTTRLRAVLAQVTAFTLAHSITLGLTLYGVVSLPASIVEPLIALSIAYVAFENLVTTELKPWRVALVFAFGLLHGMGFAEALSRLALPRSEFLTTLVGFNAGVEAGQLTVIAAASIAVSMWALPPDRYRRLVVRPASALIGAAGVVWMVQRVGLFA
jgi:HupE/UreJ protein